MNYPEKMRNALKTFKDGATMRLDSWVNNATGFGTGRDKSEYGFVLPDRTLTDIELSALYHSDDMAARMIDVIPNEMLREGFGFETGDPKLDGILNDKFDSLSAPAHLADGVRWGRCFGGAGLLIGADDGRDASQVLVPERAKDLNFLYVIDRRMLWPLSYYEDEGNPKLGQPSTYLVTTMGGTHFNTTVVHESRLILFRGAPTGIRERMQLSGWDYSVMQRAYSVLRSFNTGWKAVETLLVDGNQAIFKMTGLAEMLASGGEEVLRARMQAMDLYRSVMRAMVIDADGKETFERNTANFSNIPDTLDKFMLRLSAAVQIPVTILMGQSPAGMDATGDSDFRWFYDRIRAEQTTILAPKIRRLADIFLRTKAGQKYQRSVNKAKALGIKFPSLWTDTPLIIAQRRLAIAQGDDVYVNNQAITPEEVALARFAPDGFDREILLTKEGIDARTKVMETDLGKMASGESAGATDADGNPIDPNADPNADPAATPAAPGGAMGGAAPHGELALTATDIATIITANEARASVGLEPLPGPDGKLTLPQFKAKYATAIAAAVNAEDGLNDDGSGNPHKSTVDVQKPKAPPPPPPGFGAKVGAPLPGQPGAKPAPGAAPPFPPKKAAPPFGKPKNNFDAFTFHESRAFYCTGAARASAHAERYDEAADLAKQATAHAFFAALRMDYSEDQSRDDHGRFGSGGGGASSAGSTSSGGASTKSEGANDKGSKGTLYGKGAEGKKMGDSFGVPPPSESKDNYKPDPTATKGTGITAAARVGIAGNEAPPPFVVPRLAGLNSEERAVESRFADAFEKNPQHFIDAYKEQVYGAVKKDGSPDLEARKTFGTDDCKNLSKDYAASTENKALYNVAVHQTANMIAKAAFEQHMAEKVAKLPENERNVLVTAGGCAAGKGFALQNAPTEEVKGALGKAAAVWDTAGEQNSTELGWVQKHTESAGGSAHYVFVDADPKVAFDRVISRANGNAEKGIAPQGRVVDKLLYAESYAIGAKNFAAFADKQKDNPRAAVTYINVRTPPPSISDGVSKDTKSMTVKEVHDSAKEYIATRKDLSPAVLAGATASDHIWGAK